MELLESGKCRKVPEQACEEKFSKNSREKRKKNWNHFFLNQEKKKEFVFQEFQKIYLLCYFFFVCFGFEK